MTKHLKARFDGKTLIPLEPVDLPTETVLTLEVQQDVEPEHVPPPGSPDAVRRMLDGLTSLSPLAPGDIEAFEQAISEGKLPPCSDAGCFDEHSG